MKFQALFGFLKKQQNLKMLSAANFRWFLEGFGVKLQILIILYLLQGTKAHKMRKMLSATSFWFCSEN